MEVYLKKKAVGTVTISDFSDLIKGEEKVSWEALAGGKGFVSLGLTAESFGLNSNGISITRKIFYFKGTKEEDEKSRSFAAEDNEYIGGPPMPPREELNNMYLKLMVRFILRF